MQTCPSTPFRRAVALASAAAAASLTLGDPALAGSYKQTNLVTDDQAALKSLGFAPAKAQDRNLKNPWGLAASATGPWWSANQGSGTATIYGGDGSKKPLVVSVPQAPGAKVGPSGVTGEVAGAGGGFVFSNLDGSISAWNGGPTATVVVPSRSGGHLALYTGLAEGVAGGQAQYYAPNEITGKVDVFSSTFAAVQTAGGFVDSNLPGGFVPFGAQNIDGQIWVTYAVPGQAADDQPLGS
ncbi:MAG TPA: TIGR03118 family protein, partial [Phenylobacterium sp.]